VSRLRCHHHRPPTARGHQPFHTPCGTRNVHGGMASPAPSSFNRTLVGNQWQPTGCQTGEDVTASLTSSCSTVSIMVRHVIVRRHIELSPRGRDNVSHAYRRRPNESSSRMPVEPANGCSGCAAYQYRAACQNQRSSAARGEITPVMLHEHTITSALGEGRSPR